MIKRNKQVSILTSVLIGIGLSLFLVKSLLLEYPTTPQSTAKIWDVEIAMTFEAEGGPAKLQTYIPNTNMPFLILDEQIISRGFGARTRIKSGNKQVIWSARKVEGRHTLYYRARIQRVSGKKKVVLTPPDNIQNDLYVFSPGQTHAAYTVMEHITSITADQETMVPILLQALNTASPTEEMKAILGSNPSLLQKLNIAKQLLAQAGIHSEVIHTIPLSQTEIASTIDHWLEVYGPNKITMFSAAGEEVEMLDHLILWRGENNPSSIKGAELIKLSHHVAISHAQYDQARFEGSLLMSPTIWKLSLLSLPMPVQSVYKVLIMIPIGLLVLVLMRNFIGIKSFGTFMPILIALAFRDSGVILGISLLLILVSLGLIARFYLSEMHLLLVARQSVIVLIVILLMMLLSFLFFQLGFDSGLTISIFPMVIIALLIERMSVVWEERGSVEAVKQLAGSLVISIITISLTSIAYLSHLLFVFPELTLCIMALLIWAGRYRGFRLIELIRFKVLADKESHHV